MDTVDTVENELKENQKIIYVIKPYYMLNKCYPIIMLTIFIPLTLCYYLLERFITYDALITFAIFMTILYCVLYLCIKYNTMMVKNYYTTKECFRVIEDYNSLLICDDKIDIPNEEIIILFSKPGYETLAYYDNDIYLGKIYMTHELLNLQLHRVSEELMYTAQRLFMR